ncbi:MAG: hypothetical protein GY851_25870, partial [bacterium]|nr:hypothetical protein [bacterium]
MFLRNGQNIITALVQIWAHKGRSIRTTLGRFLAVRSIIGGVAFVECCGNYVTSMLKNYGTSDMVVYPDV